MDGEDVTGRSVRHRNVSMVYQQFINYPSLTVYDNIASPLKLAKVGRAEIDRRVRHIARCCISSTCSIDSLWSCLVASSNVPPWDVLW